MTIRALLAAALLCAPAAARADALLDRLLAESKAVSPDDIAFTRTTRSEMRGGGEEKPRVVVERFDPSRPAGQRWTLVSIDGQAPDAKQLKDYAKRSAKAYVPSYGNLGRFLRANAQRDPAATSVTYRMASLPKGSFDMNGNDLSASTRLEAQVADGPRPFVERMRMVSAKPFRMMLVAKVDQVEAQSRYKLMPDGRPVVAEQVSEIRGSMMGKSGAMRTVSTYSDHRVVKPVN
jgi:hypothetical protein